MYVAGHFLFYFAIPMITAVLVVIVIRKSDLDLAHILRVY